MNTISDQTATLTIGSGDLLILDQVQGGGGFATRSITFGNLETSITLPGSQLTGVYSSAGLTFANSNRLLGRSSSGAGAAEEISIASTLTLSGGTIGVTNSAIAPVWGNITSVPGNVSSLAALSTTNTIYYLSSVGTWTPVTIGGGISFSGGTLSSALSNFTISGAHNLTFTIGADTSLVLPASGTLATLAGTETLTNKTLTTPIIASISNTGTLTLPTSTDTLIGRATTDTLTNKTLTNGSVFFADGSDATKEIGYVSSGATTGKVLTLASTVTNNRTITFPDATDTLVGLTATQALTNKSYNGITQFDTDGTLAADSDTRVATQKATKTYVDSRDLVMVLTADGADEGGVTTPGADSTLSWSVGAGQTWTFEGYLHFTDSSDLDNISIEIASTQTVASSSLLFMTNMLLGYSVGIPNVSGPTTSVAYHVGDVISGTDTTAVPFGEYVVWVHGSLTMGSTAGVVSVAYSQFSADANHLLLKTNSWLRATKKNP